MTDQPFAALSAIAAPAILTNACAIMQNGAAMRHNLAITQWREFRASYASGDDKLRDLFVDADTALALAQRRVHLQLSGLWLLHVAVAVFAATTVGGLAGAVLVQGRLIPAPAVIVGIVLTGGAALFLLLAVTALFFAASTCSRALMRLHRATDH
jgi:hypothetical protein